MKNLKIFIAGHNGMVGSALIRQFKNQDVETITKDRKETIKLTIAKYYLPSGRTIQAVGVTPDIIAFSGKATQGEDSEFKIKEADLKKHLEGELEKVDTKIKKEQENKEDNKIITNENILNDNQLNTSIGILKSLIIINK